MHGAGRAIVAAPRASVHVDQRRQRPLRLALRPVDAREELLLAIFFTRPTLDAFYQSKKALAVDVAGPSPLAALVRTLAKRGDLSSVRIEKRRVGAVRLSWETGTATRNSESAAYHDAASTDGAVRVAAGSVAGTGAQNDYRKSPSAAGEEVFNG